MKRKEERDARTILGIRLESLADELEANELAVLVQFAERLLMGQRAYGPLHQGKKDWAKEAYEEFLDAAVYGICAYIFSCRKRNGEKRSSRPKAK